MQWQQPVSAPPAGLVSGQPPHGLPTGVQLGGTQPRHDGLTLPEPLAATLCTAISNLPIFCFGPNKVSSIYKLPFQRM